MKGEAGGGGGGVGRGNLVPRSHSVLHCFSFGRGRSGYEIRGKEETLATRLTEEGMLAV